MAHRAWRAPLVLSLALLAFTALLRAPSLSLAALDGDESFFSLIAIELLRGHWPYETLFDHKPVALFMQFAVAIGIGGTDPVVTRMLGLLAVASMGVLVALIAYWRCGLGVLEAGLLGAAAILLCGTFDDYATRSEQLVNVHVLLGLLLLTPPRRPHLAQLLAGGAAFALAFHTNYLAGFVLAGFGGGFALAALARTRYLVEAARSVLGWGLPALAGFGAMTLLLYLPLFLAGTFSEYIALQARYVTGYVTERPALGAYIFTAAGALAWTVPGVTFALFLAVQRPCEGATDGERRGALRRPEALLIFGGVLLGSCLAIVASGHFFRSYQLLAVPAVCLFVAAASVGVGSALRRFSAVALVGSFVSVGMLGLLRAADLAIDVLRPGPTPDVTRTLATMLRPHVEEGDVVYTYCAPLAIQQILGGRPAAQLGFWYHHDRPELAAAMGTTPGAVVTEILAARPVAIIYGPLSHCANAVNHERFATMIDTAGYRLIGSHEGFRLLLPPTTP
ncbi:MAG: hypothetical protein AAFP17_16560 [Pseudomonadota bacterium]